MLPEKITITYKETDDAALVADLYRSPNAASPSPTLLYFHGGGWHKGSRNEPLQFTGLVNWLLAQGMALLTVEYRLVNHKIKFPAMVHDCVDAARFFIAHAAEYGLDADRFFVGGASAGGHLSMMTAFAGAHFGEVEALASVQYRFRCILDLCGPVDLRVEKPVRRLEEQRALLRSFHNKLEGDDLFESQSRASPIVFAEAAPDELLVPVIAIHGTEDELVHPSQPIALQALYVKRGAEIELIFVQNGSHEFKQVEGFPPPALSYEDIQNRLIAFIQAHIPTR